MMRPHRPTNRTFKQRDTLDFRFSNFQALQVPKGWDRLFVSLISVETGKTIAKLGKALVKNGTCQWTETFSESFHISTYTDSSKGHEDCLVKLLVSSGSTRSNILGETSINVAQYAGSRASAAVSQPLKKCSYGTILQVKVQRLTSRSKTGDEEPKKSKFDEKDQNVDRLDLESFSCKSDNSSDSTGKPLKEDLATASRSLKLDSKEGRESATGIFYSSNSQEEYTGRENSFLKNGLKSEEYDSTERKVDGRINGGLIPDSDSINDVDDDSSNQASVNSRLSFRGEMKPKTNVGSSRKLLEVAEDTIDELRAEAKMWERNARKLMVDLDVSRNELSKLSKKHAEMRMELSAAYAEQDGLKREVEKLKLMVNQVDREDPTVRSESLVQIRKELENEIKYQQEMNDDFGQQLKRSQESNAELVSVLQELEDTIGEQKIEIENLSSLEFKYMDLEKSSSEENSHLLLQLKQLKGDIELLEKALRDKSDELENERESNRHKMLIKEEEIANLEAKCEHFENENNHEDLVREMEYLREKVEELEKDCTELTDENLELLLKLKNSNETGIRRCPSVDSMSSENRNVCLSDESVVSDPKFQNGGFESCEYLSEILKQMDVAFDLLKKPWHVQSTDGNQTNIAATEMSPECVVSLLQELNRLLEMRMTEFNEITRIREMEINDRDDVRKKMEDGVLKVKELEESKRRSEENYTNLTKEFDQKMREFDLIEANVLSKEREMNFLLQELETKVSELQQEKSHLEQEMKGERELYFQEKDHFKSVAMSLQDEIQKLRDETGIQISDLLQKSEDMLQENTKLEDMNSELKSSNHELHEKCSALVDQLNESKKSLFDCTKRVQLLEDHLTLKLEDFEVKENSLISDLEALIQEVQSEAELKVQELTDQIASSKQSHESLKDEHERILRSLASYKKSEEKLKSDLNDLELKHTISNYEREQLTKETRILKMQLQNMSGLQDEISMLKSDLKECRVDKGRTEIALHTISGDYEELKAENIQLSEKVSFFEGEFEECKRIKLHLEDKILEMDKELAAKEILCIQNADLKTEVMELKRANMQFQQKMYTLEEDRDEWLKKAHALEENVKMMKERNNIHNEDDFDHQDPHSLSMDNMTKRQSPEQESHCSRGKANNSSADGVVTRERYERTKSSLETELIDLRERYLEMSLKYAEVEGQREDLVMKLKATRSGGKRWFL